jgi:Ca-activated chloride channel family protein
VQNKVASLFRQLSAPVLTDLRLAWQTAGADETMVQAPELVPDLYAGEPLVVALKAVSAPESVDIEGRLGERRWRQRVVLRGGAAGESVHALWARRRIEDWMARRVTGEEHDKVKAAVLALALEHRLVSRYTSLVAVDRTPSRPPNGELRSGAVPTRLPAGWSGAAVFGRLPGTATPAPVLLLAGLAALLLAWATRRRRA